jgi:hypothetical protein
MEEVRFEKLLDQVDRIFQSWDTYRITYLTIN